MSERSATRAALSSGVAAADKAELKAERRAGLSPVLVNESGYLEGLDRRHVLISGSRSYKDIVRGAAFYDPTTDEVAVVIPRGGEALVRVGSLEIRELIPRRGRWNKILLDAVDYAKNSAREGRKCVSNWLVRRVAEAALLALARTSVSTGRSVVVARNAPDIWDALGRLWVSQPWAQVAGKTAGDVV